jgi:hypothetical protein
MLIKSLKLWQPVSNIIIPPAGYDDKRVALFFYGENNQFFVKIFIYYLQNP